MKSETIYTKEELIEARKIVQEAKNSDSFPPYVLLRAAKILLRELDEREGCYRRVEPKEGELVQYLAVHVLDWPWHSGVKPTDAFVEVE